MLGGVVLAMLAPLLAKGMGRSFGAFAALLPLSSLVYLLGATDRASTTITRLWAPEFGLDWTLLNDRLGSFYGIIISALGALVFYYCGSYAKPEKLGRLIALLALFYSSMIGLATAGNAFTLFLFWEATSFISYLLISFEYSSASARRSALQALLVTGLGGLLLMAGLILLTTVNGTPNINEWTKTTPLATIFVVLGCMTKSAQIPFHFWLPNAMAAPTPVSAYLHSATMVKAGVFLLFRFMPIFENQPVVVGIGTATLIWGGLLALRENDLKRIFAWATVSALGGMVMLAGTGVVEGARALGIVILAHALYKGALFLSVGAIEKHTGTRHADKIRGLFRSSPTLAVAYLLAGLGFAGIFPLAGFVAKETMLASVDRILIPFVAISGFLYAAIFVRAVWRPLRGEPGETSPVGPGLTIPPLVLGILSLAAGFASPAIGTFTDQIVTDLKYQFEPGHGLALWHGLTPHLAISIVSIAAGFFAVWKWPKIAGRAPNRARASSERSTAALSRFISEHGSAVAAVTERYSVREHMFAFFAAFVALFVASVVGEPFLLEYPGQPGILVNEAIVIIIACAAALAVVKIDNRPGAIAVLGIVGVAIALTFVTFSAPDLALTQALIDILTVVLFVLVFSRLPRFNDLLSVRSKIANAMVAILFGGCMAIASLAVLSQPQVDNVNRYYADTAYSAGHGRNVTNVIIVDYRGFDTMGEITVLCLAALGVHALTRMRPEIKGEKP